MFLRRRAIKIHRHTTFWKPSIWKTVSVEVGVKGRSCDVRRWVELPLLRVWLWYERCRTFRFILAQIFAPRCQFHVKEVTTASGTSRPVVTAGVCFRTSADHSSVPNFVWFFFGEQHKLKLFGFFWQIHGLIYILVASKCSRNQSVYETYKTLGLFKLHFLRNSPHMQLYTSASGCKYAGNIPGNHFVKSSSALPSHSLWCQ